MTASEFWPNKEDIDHYHCSLSNAKNMKRADQAEMKELSCLCTLCCCSFFSAAPCQSRTPLEMSNAMSWAFWLEKPCSALRHLGVTVSNHSPALSPDTCPHHNRRFKSYHWIQHSFVVLPSPWMCKCKGIPVYLWLYYGNLRLCVGDVFLGQDFWAWLIVLGTASSLGIVTCSRDVVISSDLCSILGQETEKLLLCQLQPAAIVALVRKGQCPRAFWPVSDSSIEPLATSSGDPFDFRRPFLSWIITLSSSWMLWLQTCKQTMRLSCNCKGSSDSW